MESREDQHQLADVDEFRAQAFVRSVPALAAIGLLGLTVDLVLGEHPQAGPYATGVLVILLVVVASIWARRASVAPGILVLDLGVMAVCAIAGLGPKFTAWWAFLLLPTVLTGGFISLPAAAVASVASLLTLLVVLILRGDPPSLMIPFLSYHLVVPPLWLFVAQQRDRLEARRRKEVEANNERLERAEALAGLGHVEVASDLVALSPGAQRDLSMGPLVSRAEFEQLFIDGGLEFREFLGAPDNADSVMLHYRRRGELRWALVTRSMKGSAVCTIQDVTDARAAAAARHAMEQRLLRAEGLEAIGSLVGESAASFEQLLAKIRSALVGVRECSEEELQKRVQVLVEAVHEGAQMTAIVLDASRPDRTEEGVG